MVRLAAPVAINSEDGASEAQVGETAEFQEGRIHADYQEALRLQHAGNKTEAQSLFKQLLAEPALQVSTTGTANRFAHAPQVRFLILKNLAANLSNEDHSCEEALQLYIEAAELDSTDTVLWHQMGTLASELEQWGIARHAFESGLRCNPHHYVIQNKLLEVLLQLADWQSIPLVVEHMFRQNPGNLRAVKVNSALHEQPDISAQLQPQLKRRRPLAAEDITAQVPAEHHIVVPSVTWKSLIQSVTGQLKQAASKGLPGAYKVVFSLSRPKNVASDTDMVSSPSAADATADKTVAASLVLDLGESDDAAVPQDSQHLKLAAVPESKAKADAAPAVAPQRASRRLGSTRAITEAGSDHDSPEPAKNVIELLAPFLAPQQEDTVDDPSGQDSSSGLAAGASPVVSSPPSAEAEEQEVWQFVNQQERNSGLHAVAAALLTRLILGNRAAAVLPQVSQEILDLESCVRGWQRSPAVALALAEMFFQAAVQHKNAKPEGSKKSKGSAQQSKHDQLLHSCTANVGMFEVALLQQQSFSAAHIDPNSCTMKPEAGCQTSLADPGTAAASTEVAATTTQPAAAVHQLLTRYHWLGGCVSEHLKQFTDAAQQYEACNAALTALSQCPGQSMHVRPVCMANSTPVSIELVDSRVKTLKLVIIVHEGRKCLDEGQHQELVGRLSPVLLGGNAAKLPLDVPQQLMGLELLQEAATGPDAWQMRLQCLLAKAALHLPPQVSSQLSQTQLHALPSPANLNAVWSLTEALAEHLPEWAKKLKEAGFAQSETLGRLLAKVQWQVLGIVMSLYGALAGSPSASSPTSRTLNVKEQQQQLGLLHAFQLLLTLRQLDARLACDQESQLRLLAIGAGLQADAGTLEIAHRAYLKTCLAALAPWFADIARNSGTNTEAVAVDLRLAFIAAAGQCVYLLYDLEILERDEAFTDGFKGKPDSRDPQTREEALCLWTYLDYFCRSLTNKKLLRAIQGKVPAPPDSVLAHFDLDALLDSADSGDPHQPLHSMPASEAQHSDPAGNDDMQIERAPWSSYSVDFSALQEAVEQDPYSGLHSHLYHLLALCQQDVFEQMTEKVMMQKQGHKQILEHLKITRFDLCYNPKRYESWERVLNTYMTAASFMANTAANHVELAMITDKWQKDTELQQRYTLYSSRALAAIQHAQLPAAGIPNPKERSDTLAFLEEQMGTLCQEQVQDAPPMYDQMKQRPDKDSTNYQEACTAGLEAFQRAQLNLNEEWEFQLYIAKMLRKLRRDSAQVLHHLAQACLLAKQVVGGSVESMYGLHAMRLKLLQQGQPDLTMLERHCFLPKTRQQLLSASMGQQHSSDSELAQASAVQPVMSASANSSHLSDADKAELIYQDAMSAMDFCLEQSRQHSKNGTYETFHKARYRRAQALHWKGQHQQALVELQPFFKGKSKHGFAINMFIIPDGIKKAAKAYAASDSSAAEDGPADQPKTAVLEEQWGETVPSLAVNGVEESHRKFQAHVRRAIILYILLLTDAKDLDALHGIVATLRTPAFALYTDVGRWAFGMYVIHLAAALQHLKLPTQEQTRAASISPAGDGLATSLPAPQLQSNQTMSQTTGSSAEAPTAADGELLEKAYQLYQDTCLSSDPEHSWDGLVCNSLKAALNFHAPNTRQLLGDNAINPEMFHKYADAYIQSLRAAGNSDKLAHIQQLTKRQMRRTNASAEACQSLYAAATAAVQAAYNVELSDLEASVRRVLHPALYQDSAGLPPAAPEAARLADQGIPEPAVSTPADVENQLYVVTQPAEPDADQAGPMEVAETASLEQNGSEVAHKQLKTALFAVLKKCLAAWKTLGAKGMENALQGPTTRAGVLSNDLLSRAYTAYLRLSYPTESFAPVQASPAATACDHLLQQVKAGVETPKSIMPEAAAAQADFMAYSTIPLQLHWGSV